MMLHCLSFGDECGQSPSFEFLLNTDASLIKVYDTFCFQISLRFCILRAQKLPCKHFSGMARVCL